jgi:enediyne biosynthesis protein E4
MNTDARRFVRWFSCVALVLGAAGSWEMRPLAFTLANGETARKQLPASVPGGFAVFDYDNDGRLDLYFPNGAGLPALLRNKGKLQFEDVTARAGLRMSEFSFGAAAGDFDGDGLVDLAVSGLRWVLLYRNKGDGTFAEVKGVDNLGRWSVAASWLDIENDGDLDLFVVNYVDWQPDKERECLVNGKPDFCHPRFYAPNPNALFRNNGDGTFTDVSEQSGIAKHRGKGMSAVTADFDSNGLTDIFVTNDRSFAFYFRNLGSGKFEEAAFDVGIAAPEDGKPVSGMGVDAQDFDNDGHPDIVYTALRDETFPLYRNSGKNFTEVTSASRMSVLSRSMSGWGVVFADVDNDGWKDIIAARSDALSATGGRGAAAMEPPSWFRNIGGGKFAAGMGWEALPRAMYRGLVAADLDDDGCVDFVFTALNSPAQIVRNPCESGGNWLKVDVRKPGTRVRVGDQWRHVSSSTGYASSYSGPLHFGVGSAEEIEVEVFLPGGAVRKMTTKTNRTVKFEP